MMVCLTGWTSQTPITSGNKKREEIIIGQWDDWDDY